MDEATGAALKTRFFSHATLTCRDIEKSRQFYEEFLGLDVVRTSAISLATRLGGDAVIVVVQNANKADHSRSNHNGLDVATREEVDRSHALALAQQEKWGIRRVTRPVEQHGTYSFMIVDLDDNWWEILVNPERGYSWMFAKGEDLEHFNEGEGADLNPNAYARRRKHGDKTPAA
ncbi:MAG TPA: VOC family protein [Stellaceae bacterium]|nr:VOC family protein [Stellaceae bacterium]